MAKEVYIASVGLTKVDLTGRIFASVFDLFSEAYSRALEDSPVRSFDALQVGIMDSEEFENRANVAAKVADRLGLTGIPAVRSETASSTGAAALHEAYYKIACGECESVLVLAGEPPASAEGCEIGVHQGRCFVSGAEAIGNYLCKVYRVGRPH